MLDTHVLDAMLRACVYVGTIASAGGVLFALSRPSITKDVSSTLGLQIRIGAAFLLLIEPLRILVFQLAISGGDLSAAFGPELRWMAFEMSPGQAAVVRTIAALALLIFGLRSKVVALVAVIAMVSSYLIEGHTAAHDNRVFAASLLFVHLMIAHWWFGALIPLAALARSSHELNLANSIEKFSRIALWAVPILILIGATLVTILSQYKLDLANAYQQRFLLKLVGVLAILTIAARNKFTLTPLLERNARTGAPALRLSIMTEIAIAIMILLATAWWLQTGPIE